MTFYGKTVLLTGASGGLGKYMARALAKPGVNLALVAWPGVDLEPLRRELETVCGRVMAIAADLRERTERQRVFEGVQDEFGTIELLVNNAGVEFTEAYHLLSEENIHDMIAVNLEASMFLTRLVLPGMLKLRRGHIVNISSLAGKAGPAFEEGYAATKAGLVAFTSSLRASYRSQGVSASVIVPGFVEAGIYARLKQRSGCTAPGVLGTSPPEKVAQALLRAIREDRFEIIVNPLPVRPLLAFCALFPTLGEWLIEKIGTNQFFREVVDASHKKPHEQEV